MELYLKLIITLFPVQSLNIPPIIYEEIEVLEDAVDETEKWERHKPKLNWVSSDDC
jgi:hypothetical protein